MAWGELMAKPVNLPNGRSWKTQTVAFAHYKAMLLATQIIRPWKIARNTTIWSPSLSVMTLLSPTVVARTSLRPRLPRPAHHVFEARQLLGAHRAAGVQAVGRDADLRAHAELAAVGELGRGVVQHDAAVDFS